MKSISIGMGVDAGTRDAEVLGSTRGQKLKRSTDRRKVRASIQHRKANVSRYLVEEALRRGTLDNTTVIVVWLR